MYNSVLKFLKGDFFHQFLLGAGRGGGELAGIPVMEIVSLKDDLRLL